MRYGQFHGFNIRATLIHDGNLTHVTNVTGNHLGWRTNADVRAFGIWFGHQHLNHIVMGIEKFFPNLLAFGWDQGNIATLTADDLEPFPELLEFYVNGNQLFSLNEDLFKHTPNLRLIHFSSNQLVHVGIGLLDSLNFLMTAHFRNNSCIDFDATIPAAIRELKLQLQNQCPPLATTTTSTTTVSTTTEPEQCPVECVESIGILEAENKRQNDEIALLVDSIQKLEEQIREILERL